MQQFKRILLKLSGEGLACNESNLLNVSKLNTLANEIKNLINQKIEIAIVIGGGNVCRGINYKNSVFRRTTLDNMGVMATILNGLALFDILSQQEIPCILTSALEINKISEFYNTEKSKEHLKQGKVVILVGGIATPFFSTDTTAIIRAAELECDAVLKATQVDGIFNKDPKKYQDAQKIDKISHDEVISKNLTVMDLQSIIIAKEAKIPIYIFNMHKENSIINLINGNLEYSIIS